MVFLILNWAKAAVLAVIQGVSTVLPLTDSGFTTVARKLLGLSLAGSDDRFFTSLLYILIALVILLTFRRDWIFALRHVPRRKNRKPTAAQTKAALGKRMLLLIVFGFLFGLPGILLSGYTAPWQTNLPRLSLLMILGGLFIFSCDRVGHGKRTLTEVTLKDAFLVGLFQALGMIPGFSPMGLGMVMGIWLGMEPVFSVRFSCLLLAPGLFLRGAIGIFSNMSGVPFSVSWIPAAALCILFTYLSLRLLRFVAHRRTLGEFSLPVWGASLFTFLLYLFS